MEAGGMGYSLLVLLFFLFVEGIRGLSEFWLADWGDSAVQASDEDERTTRSAVYAGLVCGGLVLILLRSVFYTRLNMQASRGMHHAMLQSMIRARTSFYDTTMLGRITNRFARDVEKMDMPLRMVTNMFLTTIAELLLGIATVAIATKGTMLVLLIPLIILFKLLHGYFASTSIELQRLESLSRSPIFSQFGETLEGFQTIRAYGLVESYRDLMHRRVDCNTVNVVTLRAAMAWLGVRVDVLGGVLCCGVSLLAVLFQDFADPGGG